MADKAGKPENRRHIQMGRVSSTSFPSENPTVPIWHIIAIMLKLRRPTFSVLCVALLSASLTGAPRTCAEIEAQIAKTVGHIHDSMFVTQRDFRTYAADFGPGLLPILRKPGPLHWVDLGAGDAFAMRNVFSGLTEVPPGRIRATAIGYERPKDPTFENEIARAQNIYGPDRFQYLSGKFFHEIPSTQIDRADLITDYFGVLSYTDNLSRDLEKALDRLKPGGTLMFIYSDAGFKLSEPDESTLTLLRYLKSIQGVSLVDVDTRGILQVATLVRSQTALEVPPLELIEFKATKPPTRSFRLR